MKFGSVAVGESEGAILAHSVRLGDATLKKGLVLRAEHVAALRAEGAATVTVARLETNDVDENAAAAKIAERVAGRGVRVEAPFTGRSNLFSEDPGVLTLEVETLEQINAVDESVTVATLPAFRTVRAGEMVGTVKIIPFAIARSVLEAAMDAVRRPLIAVHAFRPLSVGVVSTLTPGLKPSVVDKTLRALAARLAPAGARITRETRVPHEMQPLAAAIDVVAKECDLLIVFGASAITDRRDVIPAAVEAAGGRIERLGMPVDPGNLLLLAATRQGRPLLGAPGCARSPKENGFDWVLHRLLAGVPVGAADIRAMGAGGLLMEIVSRPQPREGTPADVETHVERLDDDE